MALAREKKTIAPTLSAAAKAQKRGAASEAGQDKKEQSLSKRRKADLTLTLHGDETAERDR